MPPIWNRKCSQGLYQDSKTGYRPVKEAGNSSNHLFGRFFTDGIYQRNSVVSCHLDGHTSRNARICGELPKIPTKSYTVNRVYEFPYKFNYAKHQPSIGQSKRYQKRVSESLENPDIKIRELARLLGKLSASIQAVFPAPLHYRHIQAVKKRSLALHWGYESQVCWTAEALEELKWWRDHLSAWNGRAILQSPPQLTIETDASTMGWGACLGNFQTRGLWSQSERLLHINCLELLAGGFALKSFLRNKCNIHVKLMMDNTTAISYINKMSGPTSLVLSSLAFDLRQGCLERSIAVGAHHFPGR